MNDKMHMFQAYVLWAPKTLWEFALANGQNGTSQNHMSNIHLIGSKYLLTVFNDFSFHVYLHFGCSFPLSHI